ncbi:MAG TPA: indolepyruvate oxidoreductase subunit beta [Clostridia bacterium]|nr:indolepyruvate oxidoreductase subunit beta [Clostridia bacterium]
MNKNILLSGMGGQGLVLMTDIICEAALKAGYEVKSNDVVGLSQRGGMVWGNVRIGDKVYSPNIREGQGDYLLAMEPLEALRWHHMLKEQGKILLNEKHINPVLVQQEVEDYPSEAIEALNEEYQILSINAAKEAVRIGNEKIANVILIGMLAKALLSDEFKIDEEYWRESIKDFVPEKAIQLNYKAFNLGFSN